MRPPYEGWGHLLIKILIERWLAEQQILVFFVFFFGVWCYGFSFPPLVCGFLSFRQTEESYQSILVR